jgi:eukaryotic-like serine/threonine-protein kinase
VLKPIPEIQQDRPGVPAAISAVVRRALATDPEERFASAGEFAKALAVSGMVPANTSLRRTGHEWAIAGMAAVVIAAVIGGLMRRSRKPAV